MKFNINSQRKIKISYYSIFNEPINPMVPIKQFSYKFEVTHMEKFKGKEDLREHLGKVKYSCYIIKNDDVLMLKHFQ